MTPWGQHARRACAIGTLITALLGGHASAQTRSSEPADEPSLVPTRSEEQTRRASVLSRELAASIESMPGVAAARVHVALPVAPDFARALASAPRAAVLVRRSAAGSAIDASGIRKLVAGAVPDMAETAVTVIELPYVAPERSAQRWSQVGPWQVAPDSATPLRAALAALLLLQLALAATLIGVVARERRRRRALVAADGGSA